MNADQPVTLGMLSEMVARAIETGDRIANLEFEIDARIAREEAGPLRGWPISEQADGSITVVPGTVIHGGIQYCPSAARADGVTLAGLTIHRHDRPCKPDPIAREDAPGEACACGKPTGHPPIYGEPAPSAETPTSDPVWIPGHVIREEVLRVRPVADNEFEDGEWVSVEALREANERAERYEKALREIAFDAESGDKAYGPEARIAYEALRTPREALASRESGEGENARIVEEWRCPSCGGKFADVCGGTGKAAPPEGDET